MQTSLRLFLFLVLLTTGASLECEHCVANGTTCTGKMETCLFNENTCVIQLFEDTRGGKMVQKTQKHCASSQVCRTRPHLINMGHGEVLRSASVCCKGKTCSKVFPKLTPVVTKHNGRKCPACYSWKGACKPELLRCNGPENFCFEMFSRKYDDEGIKNLIMMGCTTRATCYAINYGTMPELEGMDTVVIKAWCKREYSKGFRISGLILSTSAGLLLLTILF